ncbi:MAG: AzlD domain-containing protein [Spirochaetes bacterium]|nr:AzlD domain-containing protein [Spirochaetota bacterium]
MFAAVLTVVLAGAATYLLRYGGLALSDRLPTRGAASRFLRALPGALLVALVVPEVMSAGPLGWAASIIVLLLMAKTKNLLVAAGAGVLTVALVRNLGSLIS